MGRRVHTEMMELKANAAWPNGAASTTPPASAGGASGPRLHPPSHPHPLDGGYGARDGSQTAAPRPYTQSRLPTMLESGLDRVGAGWEHWLSTRGCLAVQ